MLNVMKSKLKANKGYCKKFKNCNSIIKTKIYINEETLFNDSDEDAYNIPILVIADADVFLTAKTYKMERIRKLEKSQKNVLEF